MGNLPYGTGPGRTEYMYVVRAINFADKGLVRIKRPLYLRSGDRAGLVGADGAGRSELIKTAYLICGPNSFCYSQIHLYVLQYIKYQV